MSNLSPPKRSASPGPDTIRRNYPLLLKRMEQLMEVSRQLVSTLDLSKLLRRIIQAAVELTDTEAASILLFDPRSGELRFEATTNIESAEMEGIIVPVESSIAGWIVTHSEPLVVPDTSKDARWSQQVDQKTAFVTRSILGVPLVTREKALGAVEVLNKRAGSFTEEDVTILQALAAQAAVAIVNARLFQQSDLIAEMVHELRTPLMALTATSHLLLRPELPEARRTELVGTLQRETSRLSQMTTDFLDMAKLESGRMRFTSEALDLRQLVEECIEVVQPQAAGRGIRINLRASSSLPILESDRGKIKQVILNLLTNAVKYNHEQGKITMEVSATKDGVRVSVADTGKGIPPESMAHMFEKFYRVPDSEGYSAGTGLGLPIAKKIVEALGGEIGVNSVVGKGTTFYFVLPINPKS